MIRRAFRLERVAFLPLFLILFSMALTRNYAVSGSCMQPQLITNDLLLANSYAYTFRPPHRGEIVVFHYPRDPSETYVKRVIGLPGEWVSIHHGAVYIGLKKLGEPYRVFAAHGEMQPKQVPRNSYFVLGDNRDVSNDSRYWGSVPRGAIIGRAVACYWPPQALHFLR